MSYDREMKKALREAQNLLWPGIAVTRSLPDDQTVKAIYNIICRPSVRDAMDRSNDTLPAFALRAVRRVVSSKTLPPAMALNDLRDILSKPELNHALGVDPKSRMILRLPPAG
jgi:hypothetical protein